MNQKVDLKKIPIMQYKGTKRWKYGEGGGGNDKMMIV